MGFLKATGGILKLAGKAAAVTTVAATKVAVAAAKTVYEHRETITGAGLGLAKGAVGTIRDLSGHVGNGKTIASLMLLLQDQARRYKLLQDTVRQRTSSLPTKAALLDATVVGGETLATYISMGHVPPDIQRAYELAYPNHAADHTLIEEVRRLDADQLPGLVAGVKGKLFEMRYLDYLNGGHLPIGVHAVLAESATNPGWDIAIVGDADSSLRDVVQLKATDSVAYVKEALEQHPHIDVVTTSEVYSHLVMQGLHDHVIDGHITDETLTATVEGGLDHAAAGMHWTPSIVSLALIAFSSYSEEGLTDYQKSLNFGERSMKSYLAYLAGGSLAVASGLWWVGVLGGIGSRMALKSGRDKNETVDSLSDLILANEKVLERLEATAR